MSGALAVCRPPIVRSSRSLTGPICLPAGQPARQPPRRTGSAREWFCSARMVPSGMRLRRVVSVHMVQPIPSRRHNSQAASETPVSPLSTHRMYWLSRWPTTCWREMTCRWLRSGTGPWNCSLRLRD